MGNVVNPLDGGIMGMLGTLNNPDRSFRDEVLNDVFDNITVDTVCPPDTGLWETGIQRDGNPWIIVEQYASGKLAAEEGHKKWVATMKEDRNTELTDVFEADFDYDNATEFDLMFGSSDDDYDYE